MLDGRNDVPADDPTEEPVEETDTLTPFMLSTQEFLNRYTHCVICGANLHFMHITDFARNLTQETAKCPECGVRARKGVHQLQ